MVIGALHAHDYALERNVQAGAELAAGAGQAELRLAPVLFAPGGLQPGELFPPLADAVSEVAGRIALAGTVAWNPDGARPEGDIVLLVQDLGLGVGPARVERLNGAIQFDSVAPLSTPPDQLLAVALVDLGGLPLVNGVIRFRLAEDGTLGVEQARWSWAGGEVSTGAFAYRPGEPLALTLQAQGLDIGELLEQVRVGDLEGTGTLSGAVPLRIEGGEVVVDDGELRARGPGWLRYRPQEAPAALRAGGQGVDLMLQALENFRYETLRITLDGRTDGELDVGLHISGANPELYGGYPVEFNLDLGGNLGALLRAGVQGYRLPGRIAERMERLRR